MGDFESAVVGSFVAMCGVVRFQFNFRVYVGAGRNPVGGLAGGSEYEPSNSLTLTFVGWCMSSSRCCCISLAYVKLP